MSPAEALAFVERHGVVLQSAKGRVPNLAEAIVGAPIKGSWWAHPRSHEIYGILESVCESPDVLVCKLVAGKVSYVHRRLWPAVVQLASRFPEGRLDQLSDEHAPAGKHVTRRTVFPDWVPADVLRDADSIQESEAVHLLKTVLC